MLTSSMVCEARGEEKGKERGKRREYHDGDTHDGEARKDLFDTQNSASIHDDFG